MENLIENNDVDIDLKKVKDNVINLIKSTNIRRSIKINEYDIDEIVQEIALKFARNHEKYEKKYLLFFSTVSTVEDFIKKKKTEKKHIVYNENMLDIPDYSYEENLKILLLRQSFLSMLDKFRLVQDKYAEVMSILFNDPGISPSELAEILGITENNASVIKSRAINSFTRFVEKGSKIVSL